MKDFLITRETTASLDVDAQNGFTGLCPLELPVEDGCKIAHECNKNALFASKRYMSKDAHPEGGLWESREGRPQFSEVGLPNVDIRWNRHCVVGSFGFELIKNLPHPSEYDFLVYKGVEKDMHPYSPVYHDLEKKITTGLIEVAKAQGIETFIIGGLALNYCAGQAALDLKAAGFEVIVNLAATKSIGDASVFIADAKEKGVEFAKNSDDFMINDLPF